MMYLRTARVAMVALTALGMIWTTTAHAAPIESGATSVYGNNYPGNPGTPTVPGQTGMGLGSGNVPLPGYSGPGINPNLPDNPGLGFRPDIKVTLVEKSHLGEDYEGRFLVENIGPGTASSVKVHTFTSQEKNVFEFGPIYPLGEMAPGARTEILVRCRADRGELPCIRGHAWARLTDDLTGTNWKGNDSDGSNNFAVVVWR